MNSLNKFPKFIGEPIYRNLILNLPTEIPANITFSVAQTKKDLESAFKLVHDEYVHRGFIEPQPSGMRLLIQHAFPTSSVLIVKDKDEVVGTISLIRDNPLGLPMEKVFNLSNLRRNGARLMEGSCLAIKPEYRRSQGINLFFPFLCFLHRYNRNYFGVDTVVSNLYPHHSIFYTAIQGAKVIPGTKIESYLGAPAQALMINYRDNHNDLSKIYAHSPQAKNWFQYFNSADIQNFHFPDRSIDKINDPVMTPELINYFFQRKLNCYQI